LQSNMQLFETEPQFDPAHFYLTLIFGEPS
jgi:hypothetical protein